MTQQSVKWKWFSLFWLMWLGMAAPMLGGDIKTGDIHLPSTFNPDGSYTVTIPFYHDDGYDECIDKSRDSYISVIIDGDKEYKLCWLGSTIQDESSKYWYEVRRIKSGESNYDPMPTNNWKMLADGEEVGYDYLKRTCTKSGYMAKATLTFFLPADIITKSPEFYVYLDIWGNTIFCEDYTLTEKEKANWKGKYPIPEISTHELASKKHTQEITVKVGAHDQAKEIKYIETESGKSTTGNTATWEFDMNSSREVTYKVEYKLNDCATITKENKVILYHYPKTINFNAKKAKNGGVDLSWDVDPIRGSKDRQYTAGKFIIEKKIGDGTYKEFITLNSDVRSYYDPDVLHSPNEEISYRIKRENAHKDWPFDAEATINQPLKHSIVSEFTSTRLMEARQVELEWLWNYNPKDNSTVVLEEGSQFVVTREVSLDGKNFNLDEETRFDCSEFLTDTVYTKDKKNLICKKTIIIPQSCVLYRWKIRLQPTEGHETHYKPQEDIYATHNFQPMRNESGDVKRDEDGKIVYENRPEGLNDSEIASLEYFNASHGYFGDRVELDWKVAEGSGSLDVFSVQRREYGEADRTKNPYVQIATVEALNGIVNYAYTDTKAVPGKVYEYLIEGSKECANEEVKTEDYSYGFTTPTGNIYGRLTFDSENGQAVAGAEVRLETKADISGKSYAFDGSYYLEVNDSSFLKGERTDSITFQLFAKITNPIAEQTLLEKAGMYRLYVKDNGLYFLVGKQGEGLKAEKSVTELTAASDYIQITAVSAPEGLSLYVDNEPVGSAAAVGAVEGTDEPFVMGRNLKGNIDEVRVWNRSLTADDITRTFDSYLAGDEDGLAGYWNFNYSTTKEFYDFAHKDSHYYMNDGRIRNTENGVFVEAVLSDDTPSINQLNYKDYTDSDGSYYLAGVPYIGNGTLYEVIPRLGTHEFSPTKQQVTLSATSVNHNVGFVDKSSFPVSGTIRYEGSTIPVQGVQFYVDGVVCSNSKGEIITTDAQGKFQISVPVGRHEVKAVLANHTFAKGGRIVDDYGNDINYQEPLSELELTDQTKVRLIGRVAGGVVQEGLKVGHSLSTNNLGDGVYVQLTYENPAYQLNESQEAITETKEHLVSGKMKDEGYRPEDVKKSQVEFRPESNVVTIRPNAETGEFIADLPPLDFAVKVSVPGDYYSNISGNNSKLSLSDAFVPQKEVHEYIDSILVNNKWDKRSYSDTVDYNKKQLFIARVKPVVSVEQTSGMTATVPYFGDAEISYLEHVGDGSQTSKLKLYEEDETTKEISYKLGLPVFSQGNKYRLKASVYEEYPYFDASGKVASGKISDKVSSTDAVVSFQTTMNSSNNVESVVADSTGVAYWSFVASKVDLTTASANINVKATVGNQDNATSINWTSPFDEKSNKVIMKGSVSKGSNFVTAGPDKLLAVLRDPPGSNSYSYLEKGTTFTESTTYNGTLTQEGEETMTTNVGYELVTFTGVGVGTIQSIEQTNSGEVSIQHSEEWSDSNTKTSVTTTTTQFSTSDDEDYVGAMGDVFLGYSTNLSYGSADAITLVDKGQLEAAEQTSKYEPYDIVDIEGTGYALVKTTSLEAGTSFATLFAYPQYHIESRLIPELETLRNSFLHSKDEMSESRFQAEANATGKPIYVSLLSPDNENYGRSNADKVFEDAPDYYKNGGTLFDGPSYKIYFPAEYGQRSDTIHTLNQSMDNWIARLEDNERAKVQAIEDGELIQNFSMQAGASVEYSRGYSNVTNTTNSFSVVIGGGFATDVEFDALGTGFVLEIDESLSTTQGEESSSEEEAATMVGFVLADSGNDYLSVDVYQEPGGKNEDVGTGDIDSKDLNLSTFIFRTRAGATSCPYEDEIVTQYYKPGTVISEKTLQVEIPEIAVENAFIENVPSGEPAYVTLYLRNNSAINEDAWFNLIVDDQANQLGAGLKMDGGAIGNGRTILVPAGQTLTKILEVTKGPGLNYDDLQLVLASQCQGDPTANFPAVADTVTFSVHFTPACSDVTVKTPGNNWTYNTELPTEKDKNDQTVHYMNVEITDFNVNYDNFKSIRLMYKPSSASDENWVTLMNYFNNQEYYDEAVKAGLNAEMIKAEDRGTIRYKWFLDDMPDQSYDLCAVTVCNINNTEVENFSEVRSGVKDMYRPCLFGTPQPANGILTINDDVKITFNEAIAAGYLSENNFEVTGIRNGTQTAHTVAVETDGGDSFSSELERSFRGKDITIEAWINVPEAQDAVIFRHGTGDEALSFGMTKDHRMTATVNGTTYTSESVEHENYTDNWNHVALVLDQNEDCETEGKLTLYYNFTACLERDNVPVHAESAAYNMAEGLRGQIHNVRVWTEARTNGQLQTQSNLLLSGNETGLLSYYPMDEAGGNILKDKARGLNLKMNGGTWLLPEGRGLMLNGTNSYLKLNSGSSVVADKETDYTIELWFKGDKGNRDATLLASGRADGTDWGGSENLFFLGFENGELTYRNNGQTLKASGDWLDNNWHHVAVSANRMTDRIQLYTDGMLNIYAPATEYGQIAAGYIYTGVTPVAENGTNVNVEKYWNGSLDDVRFWNLYKNEKAVATGMNRKLDGKEMGLMGYYPFEKHTVTSENLPVVRFSLEDAKVQELSTTHVPDAIAVIGGMEIASIESENREIVENAFMTSQVAPVKDKGGVTDLDFDYVVNNDALIITLKEEPARIENTTVTFTVSGVRDLNGNSTQSGITWTAYIDRNQLKWVEDEQNLQKNVDEPMTFTVDITNKGGKTEDYSITGYPSWIDVSAPTGTLAATQTAHITFTVDESVNIGTYNEVFYLTNSDGISEPLNVTLKVNGKRPDWTVNPADYKFNMSVYGQMKINGRFSNDTEDMLAAFEDDVCVGVATNEYIKVNDMYYALLTVYGNTGSHNKLEFKMWDASTGKIYIVEPETPVAFKANSIVGSPKVPVVFSNLDKVQLDVALNNGWTWTSFNVMDEDMNDLSQVLKNNAWLSGDEVKREDGGVATYGAQTGWVGSLNSLDNEGMFMIRSSYPQTLSVIGSPVNPANHILDIRSVNEQGIAVWNYIPYLSQENLPLTEALAGYEAEMGDVVKSQSAFAMWNGNLGWIGSLTYMQPGRGYMLQRTGTTTATLRYPSTENRKAKVTTKRNAADETMENHGVENTNYARTMSMVATVEGVELAEGDVLRAYINGELRGESPVICQGGNDEPLFFLSVAGEQSGSIDMTVERRGEIVASATDAGSFNADAVEGTYDNPMVISFDSRYDRAVYPSPFYNELFIRKQVDAADKVTVTITDAKGAKMALLTDCNEGGQVDIHYTDALNLSPGVYMVNICVNGKDNVYKVIKVKR